MNSSRLIRTLTLKNFLSYGRTEQEIELQSLNVLIGPNASGKSNLIEALSLLRAAPKDLTAPIREGGGIAEWIFKGTGPSIVASIECTVDYPQGIMPLRYKIAFAMVGQRFELVDEAIENERITDHTKDRPYFFYQFQNGHPVLSTTLPAGDGSESGGYGRSEKTLKREDINPEQSVLSQRKDAEFYPELTYLGNKFAGIRLYREWTLGRYTAPRMPQKADLPADFLLEDASNLGLILNALEHQTGTKDVLMPRLKAFYEGIEHISTKIEAGTVQVYLHERGLGSPVPATRLSDGMLRYLCLLSVLCHPNPPPLICIEEPELGLHPDILPTIAELLHDASQRTQIVVTTHSDILVSALSEYPESIMVCERTRDGSSLRRLASDQLKDWLKDYTLGELWRMGELGGTRW